MIPGESRRLKILTIDPDTLIAMLTQPATWSVDGVPEGAKVIDCGYDLYRRAFYVTLEHESFEQVPDGEYIPALLAGLTVEFGRAQEVGVFAR